MITEGRRAPDWWGRGVGLAVFFLGIALLIVVFVWTFGLRWTNTAGKLEVMDAVKFGVEVVKLFVLGLVASWIAGRGAQLYAAANRALSGD
jgi:hypothetical protein